MIHEQRNKIVEMRADLILTDKLAVDAYAVHFESQMCRSKALKLLKMILASYVQFAGTGSVMFVSYPIDFWQPH
jgi:hypothetical protein